MAINKDQRRRFLEDLENHATVTRAARSADIKQVSELYKIRREDDEFRLAWDDALLVGRDACEDAARDRAFFGKQKPVFQGGLCVGHVVEYSDSLAKLILEADKPERYSRGSHLHITGNLKTQLDGMTDEELNKFLENKAKLLGMRV